MALKVLPFAAAMDAQQLRRFWTEAQAAAQLHHTNIVPVYWVGCERGVHYYAMQFIEGRTLADMVRELRQLEGKAKPRRGEAPAREGEAPAEPGRGRGSPGGSPSRMAIVVPREGEAPAEPPEATNEGQSPQFRLEAQPPAAEAGTANAPGAGSPDGNQDAGLSPASTDQATVSPPASSTRDRAYFRNVARLGVEAAEALDHAQQEGIVHRDIKPANLMVDAKGNLWVTDFGLARLQSDSGLTITGDVLGTLRYMSPEQALGKRVLIDGWTDIYSLGATLYELTTLQPAFDSRDRQELLRRIAEEEPQSPRKLNGSVPRELETILLKAMSKEPESRYATAQELADDLRRFLDHKPIKARRPSLLERAAKWARRHRGVVATAFVILLVVAVALAANSVSISRKEREVERQRDEARQAVDDMYSDVAEHWLGQRAALEPMQQKFLQKALDYYQRFGGEQSTDAKVRLKTAAAYRRVGSIHRKLGRSREAEAVYRRAITILDKLVADVPSVPEYRGELAASYGSLGALFLSNGNQTQAEPLLRRSIALGEKLATESPAEPQYQNDLATSQNNLGQLLSQTGRGRDAEPLHRRAMALLQRLVYDSPSVPGYRTDLASTYYILGVFLEETGRLSEAEPAYRQAIALAEKLTADSPSVPESQRRLMCSQDSLGVLLAKTGRLAEAEPLFRRATELGDRLVAGSPYVPLYLMDLATSYNNLGGLLKEMGRLADAEQAIRRAIALEERFVDGSPSVPAGLYSLAMTHGFLAEVLQMTGQHAGAEHAFRRMISLLEKLTTESPSVPRYPSMLATAHNDLSRMLWRTGRHIAAEQEFRRALALLEKMADVDSQNYLAWILTTNPDPRLRDVQRALRCAKNAVERDPKASSYRNTLGVAHYRAGDWKAAIDALEKSIEPRAGGVDPGWFFLAMAHYQTGQKDQARQWYDRAVESMEMNRPHDDEPLRFRDEAAALLGVTQHPASSAKKEENTTRPSKP